VKRDGKRSLQQRISPDLDKPIHHSSRAATIQFFVRQCEKDHWAMSSFRAPVGECVDWIAIREGQSNVGIYLGEESLTIACESIHRWGLMGDLSKAERKLRTAKRNREYEYAGKDGPSVDDITVVKDFGCGQR
jgi:hypothetical protein